jgi:putative hydrolase of the HAD superfamily
LTVDVTIASSLAGHVDAVLFDVGGVLLVPHPRFIRPVLAPFGLDGPDSAFEQAHYNGVRAMHLSSTESDDWDTYHQAFIGVLDNVVASQMSGDAKNEAAAAVRAAMAGRPPTDRWWTHRLPGGQRVLAELHRRSVPIGIVSNADGSVEADLLDTEICQVGAGAGAPVAVIVDSHLVGVAKPDPSIFDHALPALGAIDRSRVAYVGDTVRNDVNGARAAGLIPVQIDPFDLFVEADWHRIRSLDEILTWFPDRHVVP